MEEDIQVAGQISMELITTGAEPAPTFHHAWSSECVSFEDEWVYGDSWHFKHGIHCPCTNICPISSEHFTFHDLPLLSLLLAPGCLPTSPVFQGLLYKAVPEALLDSRVLLS